MFDLKDKALGKFKRYFSDSSIIVVVAILVTAIMLVISSKMNKDIAILVDGNTIKVDTYRPTVADVLKSEHIVIGPKDKVFPGPQSGIKDNMTIIVKRAVPISITVDGKQLSVNTGESTVADMLKSEGIILNEKDRINPGLDSIIANDMDVKIVRVEEKTVTVTEKIAYRTLKKKDDNVEKGAAKVLQDGVDGEKEITSKIVLEDGIEVSTTRVGEIIKKSPVDKIIAVGTLAWFVPSRGNSRIYYTRRIKMKATSYTANYECTGKNPGDKGFGYTATGAKAKRNSSGYSTVAVDPSQIPLGTKLYIEGYGYAIAEDTGGAVKGNIIDLFFTDGSQEYLSWSTHSTRVYILK
jgi:uncharacterized protein YabE (DUF348 family)